MSRDANIATQEKAAERLNAGDVDTGVDLMFAPDAHDHDPAPDQEEGREGFRRFFHSLIAGFPDFAIAPEIMVADDESIAFAYTLTGTHQGEFAGIAPTGRRIEVRGLQVGRFENAQIVERWGATDMQTLIGQLTA